MPRVAPAFVSRLGLVLAACIAAVGACHGPDPYYRTSGADASIALGKGGTTGAAGTSGAAGTTGDAGVLGAAGTGSNIGGAGTGGPCTTCRVNVQYTCRSDRMDTSQASFVLNVTNDAPIPITLSDLTLRYWYQADPAKTQWLECDVAELGCSNVASSTNQASRILPNFVFLTPPRKTANVYVEVGFSPATLTLDPFLDTGEIQLRLHNKDYTEIDQKDDYSFDDTRKGNPVEWKKITAYLKGVLIWGTEPL